MAAQATAEDHQQGQEALVALIPALLREAWPLLDVHDIKATLPRFVAAVRAIVERYGLASASAALDYYRQERSAQVPGPAPTLRIAPSPADSVIEDAVGWATSDLYGTVTPESEQRAMDRLAESVQQLVLDRGRDSIIAATVKDKAAIGWARVTEQGACSFCLMLALRAGVGLLYSSKRAGSFKAHDNCRCHVEPVFTAYEPSHRMREMQRLWDESTKGRSGHDARVAFRQAVEGREVTGAPGKPGRKGHESAKGLKDMSPAQIRQQIALTEGLKDSEWRTQQLARLRKQLRTAQ